MAILPMTALLALVWGICACSERWLATFAFKACVPCGFVLQLWLWLAAGTLLALTLVASDVCSGPDDTILRVVTFDNSSINLVDTATFYLDACRAADPTNGGATELPDVGGAYGAASAAGLVLAASADILAMVAGNVSQAAAWIQPYDPHAFDAVLAAATNASDAVTAATAAVNATRVAVDCSVRGPWVRTLDSMCNAGITMGLFPLFVGFSVAAAASVLLLCAGAAICGRDSLGTQESSSAVGHSYVADVNDGRSISITNPVDEESPYHVPSYARVVRRNGGNR
jgi:hypothetical protein